MQRFRAPLRGLIATFSLAGLGINITSAAPDDAGINITRPFTAKEVEQGYSDQKILAMPLPAIDASALATAELAAGLSLDRSFDHIDGLRVLRVPSHMSPGEARAALAATGLYQFVEYDHLRQAAVVPNDPAFVDGSQWHHQNTGQSGGTAGADIGSVAAWDIRSSAANVIVAVIDSGARLTHQDIAPNLWTNPGEIAGNNRDDDGNGYIDDVHGINARNNSGDPSDEETDGHGTHVTGLVGAAGNNNLGTVGVAWQVQLMPLRFLGGTEGNGSTSDEIECINYAIAKGADVINASYGADGEDGFSQGQIAAIRRARDAGIVFVAAAGNESTNLDLSRSYPASYEIDNVIAVGNATRLDDRSTSSNTGSGSVDLFAPGSEIVSTGVTSDTAVRTTSGTSMAAPIVSGAVALLKAQYPQDNYRATINRLLRGTRPASDFAGHAITGGRLHVADALLTTDNRPFHDDFATRARLVGNVVKARSSTFNATTESGEPAHAGRLSRSLWFSWTAPANGIVSMDTRGSEGDTQLAVYTGDSVSALNLVVSNDNENAGFLSSRVSFSAVAETTYQIAVDNSAAGMVILNITSALANDAFDSAQPLDGDAPLITTTNASATRESGEPTHVTGANGKSLWYSWEAPRDGTFQVSAYSITADTALAIYTGSSVSLLTRITSNDDTGINNANLNALAEFDATEGTVYYIALDTLGSDSAEITLSLTDAVWQFATGDRSDTDTRRPTITNAPAIDADGTLYVSSADSFFYALNPDGTLKWRTATEAYSDSSAAAVAPDGTIHFGTLAGSVYALNADGSIRWTSTLGDSAYVAAPAVAADGTVYYKQDDGTVRAFSTTGAQLWTYSVPGEEGSYAGPAITIDGTLIVPANDGALHALSPDGNLLWQYQPLTATATADTSGIYTSPSIDAQGNIYASSLNGTVFSVTDEGQLRWVFRTPAAGENVSSSLALGDGRAYFASYGGFLYALDQASGAMVWRASIEAQARSSSPAIAADGSIIVGSYANKLFRFSSDGQQIRAWSAGNWFRSSPTLADGRIYVGNGDGKIYAFDLEGVGPAPINETYPWPQYRHGPRHLARATVESVGQAIPEDPSNPGRLVNLSVRNRTDRGTDVLIAGFVLAGDTDKELVVRGIGPTLANFGVTSTVEATEIKVYTADNTSAPLTTNRGWTASSGDGRELGAFALPNNSADSVVRQNFNGGGYTAQVLPATTDTDPGVALIEIYDAHIDDLSARLTNLSARTRVAANGTVTVGFVLGGTTSRSLLIRAVGPGLAEFGVTGTLADPALTLLRGQTPESVNDDWGGNAAIRTTAETVGAFPLLSDSADAALLTRLAPGAYTAQITAPAGQSGIVLVEVYLVAE